MMGDVMAASTSVGMSAANAPTPAPVVDGEAREKALEKALTEIAAAKTKRTSYPKSYQGGFDAGCDWAARCAERALLSVNTLSGDD